MKKYLLLVCLVGACMLSACSAKGQQKSSETSENAVTIFDDLSFWPRSYCVSNGEIWAYGFVEPKEKEEGSVIAAKLDAAGTVEFVAFEGQTVW